MEPLVDSHCHLDFEGLASQMPAVLQRAAEASVARMLCVAVNLENFPQVLALAERHANIYASVGLHPDYQEGEEPTEERLLALAAHPRVLAIGETGLDYYRCSGDMAWQQERFRVHIRAARRARKPLIIHTREAAADTIRIMQQEQAEEAGGVMHCFTENWAVAQQALALGFYISLSGIVTFRSAEVLRDVAARVPLERLLVETDAPYLAPVPYRGRTNEPAYVRKVAEQIAAVRGIAVDEVARATTENFARLFRPPG